jgi:hypothetical protein
LPCAETLSAAEPGSLAVRREGCAYLRGLYSRESFSQLEVALVATDCNPWAQSADARGLALMLSVRASTPIVPTVS